MVAPAVGQATSARQVLRHTILEPLKGWLPRLQLAGSVSGGMAARGRERWHRRPGESVEPLLCLRQRMKADLSVGVAKERRLRVWVAMKCDTALTARNWAMQSLPLDRSKQRCKDV